jgi:hypothetical protein
MKAVSKLFCGLLLVLAIPACRTVVYPSAEVNYLSGDEATVTVRAVGVGSDREKALLNAEEKAFDVLLFRGLPASAQKLPLVGSNEAGEKKKHAKYFNDFYAGRRFRTFIMSAIPVTDLAKSGDGQKMITLDVKINLSALRRDLETFGVTRKFGY